jgi:hypothetical protein
LASEGIQVWLYTIGAGYLDIQAALSSTDFSSGVAKSPTAQYDPATNSVYFVKDSSAMWGSSTSDGGEAVSILINGEN